MIHSPSGENHCEFCQGTSVLAPPEGEVGSPSHILSPGLSDQPPPEQALPALPTPLPLWRQAIPHP